MLEELSTSFAQAFLTLVFLPYHAHQMLHAIVLTLVRLAITQRRLLDWETAATQAASRLGFRTSIYADDSGPALDVAGSYAIGGYTNLARLDEFARVLKVGGELWPMPFNVSSPVLYYDKGDLGFIQDATANKEPLCEVIAFQDEREGIAVGGMVIALYMPMFKIFTLIE